MGRLTTARTAQARWTDSREARQGAQMTRRAANRHRVLCGRLATEVPVADYAICLELLTLRETRPTPQPLLLS